MKTIIISLLLLTTFSAQAQEDNFDQKKSQSERELELIKIIQSDSELYRCYKSGKRNINAANGLGIFSLFFMTANVVIAKNRSNNSKINTAFTFFYSSLAAAMTGITAIILKSKGKRKIKDAINHAEGRLEKPYGYDIKLQTTPNGIGLVYSF